MNLFFSIFFGLFFFLFSTFSHALNIREQYEETLINWALQQQKLVRETDPNNKIIEKIIIVRENIIAKSDIFPSFFNIIHFKTREFIIRQELLLNKGDLWKPERISESARNLRRLSILAVVRFVPCQSKNPNKIILLIVTKDLWSLRFNSSYNQNGTVLKRMEYFPTEMNLLGINKQLSLHIRLNQFDLDGLTIRDHLALGELYYDPRLLGSRLKFYQRFDFILNGKVPCGGSVGNKQNLWCPQKPQGSLNGIFAQISLSRPLYALSTKWGFEIYAAYASQQNRAFTQSPLSQHQTDDSMTHTTGLRLKTLQFKHPNGKSYLVPYVFDATSWFLTARVTRSFGNKIKQDITTGLSLYRQENAPPLNFPFDQTTQRWFSKEILARNESAYFWFLQYTMRGTSYIRLKNIQSFALSEDYRLGPYLSAEIRLAREIDHPSQYFAKVSLSVSYRWNIKKNLLYIGLYASTRFQPLLADLGYDAPWANNSIGTTIKNISPLI